jgi:hypothetical protein
MENRLVYLAGAAGATEQQENSEASQTEKNEDGELQKNAEDLAKLQAKPGGRQEITNAKDLIDNPNTTQFVKELLKKKIVGVEAAVNDRKNKLSPETTEALNKANAELKKAVENTKTRLTKNAELNSEFGRMASLGNANEIFKDVKVSMKSIGKGGSVELKWSEFDSPEKISQLGIEQKQALIKAMNDELAGNTPEGAKGIETMKNNLLSNTNVPESWKEWLKNPESWEGGSAEQKNLAYVTGWVNKNLGPLVIQTEKFKNIADQADANPKAAEQLSQKGVKCSLEKFRESSRTDRNEILKNYSETLAGADSELAKKAAEAGVSDGTEAENIQTKNTAEMEKQVAETEKTAVNITPKLQEFIRDQKITQAIDAKKTELEEQTKDAETVDDVANLRTQAQSGEKVGWLKKMFGKKETGADDPETSSKEKEGEEVISEEVAEAEAKTGKEFDPEALARKQVMAEKMGDTKTADALKKTLGVREGISAEDLSKLSELATLQKTDTETVKAALTPELKRILEMQAEDENKAK